MLALLFTPANIIMIAYKSGGQASLLSRVFALVLAQIYWVLFLSLSFIYTHKSIAAEMPSQMHHHLHSFAAFYFGRNSIATKHAEELGYAFVTNDRSKASSTLGNIKLSNSYLLPLQLDMAVNSIQYLHWTADDEGMSLLRRDRATHKRYPLDRYDLQMLTVYGCMRTKSVEPNADMRHAYIKQNYYTGWEAQEKLSIVANLQSKYVVRSLATKMAESYMKSDSSAMFLDDLARNVADCVNKDAGDEGSFPSWKEGQKALVTMVQNIIRESSYDRGYVFANIWHPLDPVNKSILQWYADGSLRLDHYYLESGPQENRSIVANGVVPNSRRPAYVDSLGYLPADKVSISTSYGWYGERIADYQKQGFKTGKREYILQHFNVAGLAAVQGSWFGWYGESGPDRRELSNDQKSGSLVHTNDLQLLRAIPGWDNLASVPLGSRDFNDNLKVYSSPNSFFSPQVIYSRHFGTGELFAVFKSSMGRIKLRTGEKLGSAWFANHYFGRTDESAVSCLQQSGDAVTLVCEDAIDRGIRINLKSDFKGK